MSAATPVPVTHLSKEPIAMGRVAIVQLQGRGLVPCLITGLTGRDGVHVRPLKPIEDTWDQPRRVAGNVVFFLLDSAEVARLDLQQALA